MNRRKLKEVLGVLSGVEDNAAFKSVDEQLAQIGAKLKETMSVKTIEEVNKEFKTLQKLFTPLLPAFETLKKELLAQEVSLNKQLQDKLEEFNQALSDTRGTTKDKLQELANEVATIKGQLSEVQGRKIELPNYMGQITELGNQFSTKLKDLKEYIDKGDDTSELQSKVTELEDITKRLKTGIEGRGGAMGRSITVGGVNYLTKYTDLNLIAGTNMSIAVADDNAKKRVNITFNASGGGSGTNFETPTGTVNDTNTTFTVINTPAYINVNGLIYTVGNGIYTSFSAPTITLSSPVGTGGFIISAY